MEYPYAVDFDGVLHSYVSPWTAHDAIPDPPIEGAIEWLNEVASVLPVVVFTTRASTEEGTRAVQVWLRDWGLTSKLVGITSVKPPSLALLDDRAIQFRGPGTYPSVAELRAFRPWWAAEEGSGE